MRRLDELARAHEACGRGLRAHAPWRTARTISAASPNAARLHRLQRARLVAGDRRDVGELVRPGIRSSTPSLTRSTSARSAIDEIRDALAPACPPADSTERSCGHRARRRPTLLADVERGIAAAPGRLRRRPRSSPSTATPSRPPSSAALRSSAARAAVPRWSGAAARASGSTSTHLGRPASTRRRSSSGRTFWDALGTAAHARRRARRRPARRAARRALIPDAAQAQIARGQRSIERARRDHRRARTPALTTRVPLPLDDALDADTRRRARGDRPDRWTQALAAAHADRARQRAQGSAELAFLDGAAADVDELLDRGDYDGRRRAPGGPATPCSPRCPRSRSAARLLDGPLRRLCAAAAEDRSRRRR